MTFSKETLEATMQGMTEDTAMRLVALAGNGRELKRLINGLARNFNASIPASALTTLDAAITRWNVAPKSLHVSYKHD